MVRVVVDTSSKSYLPALVVSVFCLLYVSLLLSQVGFNPTALADIGAAHPQYNPRVYPAGTIVWKDSIGYDGQFYYQIALHPFDLKKFYSEGQTLGEIPFRYQRILYPLLAFLFSFGNPVLIPWTLIILNVSALTFGALFLVKILDSYVGKPWLSLFYGLSVSSIVALRFDMPQVLALSLGVASLYYFARGKLALSFLMISLSMLTYEASVLFLLAMVWDLLQRRDYKNVLFLGSSIFPFLLYELLLYSVFGQLPLFTSGSNIGVPFAGLLHSARYFWSFRPFSLVFQGEKYVRDFDFGLMMSAGLVIIFSLFVYSCLVPGVSRFRQSVFHKALFLQVAYAVAAAPGVYDNFYNVARVFGAVFPLLAVCYTIAPARYYRYLLSFGALFTLVALAPYPNVLQTYHSYFLLP